jgi:hypothetical protein
MDFTVEVDVDACYAIDVLLKEHRFGPISDDIVLANANAFVQPSCLTAGPHEFRITTAAPAPAGSTPPSPAPAGAVTLPPIDGKWPDHISSSLELYYAIDVYKLGPCTAGAPPTCSLMPRFDLGKHGLHMKVEGPNTGGNDPKQVPLERQLMALVGPHKNHRVESAVALASRREPAPPVAVSDGDVSYVMQRLNDASTLHRDGIVVERLVHSSETPRKTIEFRIVDVFPSLQELGRSLHLLEQNKAATPAVMVARSSIRRHGLMTVFEEERVRSTYFVNDTGVMVWFDGTGPGWLPPVDSEPPGRPIFLANMDKVDLTIGVKDTADQNWFFWAENAFSALNPMVDYTETIQDIIKLLHNVAVHAPDRCIEKLHIMSHGNAIHARGASGAVTGSYIKLGEGTTNDISSLEFDGSGNAIAGSNVEKLINELKRAMCPNGKIVFSACNQGVGGLLQNISKAIDKGITVNGFSGTGNPLTEGDLNFKDGVKQ